MASRAPWRADRARSCWRKTARLRSNMPRTSVMKTGRTIAASTRVAPRRRRRASLCRTAIDVPPKIRPRGRWRRPSADLAHRHGPLEGEVAGYPRPGDERLEGVSRGHLDPGVARPFVNDDGGGDGQVGRVKAR